MLISFRLGGALVEFGSGAIQGGGGGASRPAIDAGAVHRNMQIYHYFDLCIATLARRKGLIEMQSFSS
jgi:hypothetical protein